MSQPLRLVPECHADTALAHFFVPNIAQIDHAFGISNVATEMQKTKNRPVIMVGIVDNDKRKPRYFDDFVEFDRGENVIFKENQGQYLVILDKAIETFILANATSVSVDMSNFGFSDDFKQLSRQLKTLFITQNVDFKNLLAELKIRKAPDFVKIQTFLDSLK